MDRGPVPFGQPGFFSVSVWTVWFDYPLPPCPHPPERSACPVIYRAGSNTSPPSSSGSLTVHPHFYCPLNTYLGEDDNAEITEGLLPALWFGCSSELAHCLKRVLTVTMGFGELVERGAFRVHVHCEMIVACRISLVRLILSGLFAFVSFLFHHLFRLFNCFPSFFSFFFVFSPAFVLYVFCSVLFSLKYFCSNF